MASIFGVREWLCTAYTRELRSRADNESTCKLDSIAAGITPKRKAGVVFASAFTAHVICGCTHAMLHRCTWLATRLMILKPDRNVMHVNNSCATSFTDAVRWRYHGLFLSFFSEHSTEVVLTPET
mmetsp:Transcript_120/g.307  ORF Transcript_120/g.307 Transcript_120/m.307 type:complete len:125 (+) Transcript_120:738-1112(+)